jgi:hypothetical protein
MLRTIDSRLEGRAGFIWEEAEVSKLLLRWSSPKELTLKVEADCDTIETTKPFLPCPSLKDSILAEKDAEPFVSGWG